MASVMVMQGRRLDESDMGMIRGLLDANPGWNRTRLSRELCPLSVSIVAPGSADARLFNGLLAHEHYLGHRNTVGENLR